MTSTISFVTAIDRILLLVLPLLAMFILPVMRATKFIRWYTLGITSFIFLFSIVIFCGLNDGILNTLTGATLYKESMYGLLSYFNFGGISGAFIILTAFIMPISILAGWNYINFKIFAYIMLTLEFLLFIAFSITNLFGFFIAFETILIPMFLLIGVWGSRAEKIKAAYYFFFYTLVGSILLLISIILIQINCGSTTLGEMQLSTDLQYLLWPCFFIAFAVKIPSWPFHLWLPEAHVEAPTVGSVILASLLLKLGGYGYIRFMLPLFTDKAVQLTYWPLVSTFAVCSIVFASLTAIRQVDVKRIIAYTSISHMNLAVLGIFSYTLQGLNGSIALMIGHGFVSAGLFLGIGVIYDRYHSRLVKHYSGLAQPMPLFALFFLFLSFANMAFPGTYNFVGEFLIMLGLFKVYPITTILASLGMLFSGVYSVWLANRILFGDVKTTYIRFFSDMTLREVVYFMALVIPTVYFGILPSNIDNFLGDEPIMLLRASSGFVML